MRLDQPQRWPIGQLDQDILLIHNARIEERLPDVVVLLLTHLKRVEFHRHPLDAISKRSIAVQPTSPVRSIPVFP